MKTKNINMVFTIFDKFVFRETCYKIPATTKHFGKVPKTSRGPEADDNCTLPFLSEWITLGFIKIEKCYILLKILAFKAIKCVKLGKLLLSIYFALISY